MPHIRSGPLFAHRTVDATIVILASHSSATRSSEFLFFLIGKQKSNNLRRFSFCSRSTACSSSPPFRASTRKSADSPNSIWPTFYFEIYLEHCVKCLEFLIDSQHRWSPANCAVWPDCLNELKIFFNISTTFALQTHRWSANLLLYRSLRSLNPAFLREIQI